jgi:thymidine kinase
MFAGKSTELMRRIRRHKVRAHTLSLSHSIL